MRTVTGVVQHYPWGDTEVIPRLLGVEPDGRPWAELWFGTHHRGPATLPGGDPLATVSGDLPYLLKVLAAAEPLSLQTHPDAATAREGFAREEALGLPAHHAARTYHDGHAKPELLCALTPFDALSGFRPVADTLELLERLGVAEMAAAVRDSGLAATVDAVYRGELDAAGVVRSCATNAAPEAVLVRELWERYPGDPSVALTLLLNRVSLRPGQAIFLGPGNLHAYLGGAAVEVMGPSDNVVRGGLTTKHVDVDELRRVLHFEPLAEPVVDPVDEGWGRWRYPTAEAPFELWRFDVVDCLEHVADGHELLLCAAGDAGAIAHGTAAHLAPGERVALTGPATVFRVTDAV